MAAGINTVSPLSRVSNELPSDNKARAPINQRPARVSRRRRCKKCTRESKKKRTKFIVLLVFAWFPFSYSRVLPFALFILRYRTDHPRQWQIPDLPIQIFIPKIALTKQARSSGRMNDELHSPSFYLRSYIRREIAERKQEEEHTEWCLTNWETGLQLNPLCAMSRFEFGLVRQVSDSFCRDALSHQTRLINDPLSLSLSFSAKSQARSFPFFSAIGKIQRKMYQFRA